MLAYHHRAAIRCRLRQAEPPPPRRCLNPSPPGIQLHCTRCRHARRYQPMLSICLLQHPVIKSSVVCHNLFPGRQLCISARHIRPAGGIRHHFIRDSMNRSHFRRYGACGAHQGVQKRRSTRIDHRYFAYLRCLAKPGGFNVDHYAIVAEQVLYRCRNGLPPKLSRAEAMLPGNTVTWPVNMVSAPTLPHATSWAGSWPRHQSRHFQF